MFEKIDSDSFKISLPVYLTEISNGKAVFYLALDWFIIFLCFSLSIALPYIFVYFFSSVIIARTQLALAVLMHEAAHRTFLKKSFWNDWVCQFFCAGPLSFSLFTYRMGHNKHHRAPMTGDDPVAVIFQIDDYPIPRRELIFRLCKDITGIAYFLTVFDFAKGKYKMILPELKQTRNKKLFVFFSIFIFHIGAATSLYLLGHIELYFYLWILPSLTFLQFFARIRAIAEHAGYPPTLDQKKNARSIIKPSWQTFFCGPHAIHYHIEHHEYVRVPFYHLQELHLLLRAKDILPKENLYRGYGQILKDVSY